VCLPITPAAPSKEPPPASLARRLQSLGALTRGDRRAASGLDLSELNLDTPLGRKSLRRMYDHIVQVWARVAVAVVEVVVEAAVLVLVLVLRSCLGQGGC
jgi:hypothetical protein